MSKRKLKVKCEPAAAFCAPVCKRATSVGSWALETKRKRGLQARKDYERSAGGISRHPNHTHRFSIRLLV
jgi:hypothetical protein